MRLRDVIALIQELAYFLSIVLGIVAKSYLMSLTFHYNSAIRICDQRKFKQACKRLIIKGTIYQSGTLDCLWLVTLQIGVEVIPK